MLYWWREVVLGKGQGARTSLELRWRGGMYYGYEDAAWDLECTPNVFIQPRYIKWQEMVSTIIKRCWEHDEHWTLLWLFICVHKPLCLGTSPKINSGKSWTTCRGNLWLILCRMRNLQELYGTFSERKKASAQQHTKNRPESSLDPTVQASPFSIPCASYSFSHPSISRLAMSTQCPGAIPHVERRDRKPIKDL